MSLVINTTTPEGLVIAADSRQSYRNRKGTYRIGSDNAKKLFQINKRIGVGITGLAFIQEDGILKNVSSYIDDYSKNPDIQNLDVLEVAKALHNLLTEKYNPENQITYLENNIKKDLAQKKSELLELNRNYGSIKFKFKDITGNIKQRIASIDIINFLICGFNKDGTHEVYTCYLPGTIQKKRDSKEKGREYGASWLGQTDVVSRIVLGLDSRIRNVKPKLSDSRFPKWVIYLKL